MMLKRLYDIVWCDRTIGGWYKKRGPEEHRLYHSASRLTDLFPTEVSSFDFQVECTDRTVQYKLDAQSLPLFGLYRDVNDSHRAGANRLQNKTNHGEMLRAHGVWRRTSTR